MNKADLGLIGLAVMGQNLVLNMNDHGFKVAVFNRTTSVVDEFMAGNAKGTNIIGTHSLEELVDSLASPRRVMLLLQLLWFPHLAAESAQLKQHIVKRMYSDQWPRISVLAEKPRRLHLPMVYQAQRLLLIPSSGHQHRPNPPHRLHAMTRTRTLGGMSTRTFWRTGFSAVLSKVAL